MVEEIKSQIQEFLGLYKNIPGSTMFFLGHNQFLFIRMKVVPRHEYFLRYYHRNSDVYYYLLKDLSWSKDYDPNNAFLGSKEEIVSVISIPNPEDW